MERFIHRTKKLLFEKQSDILSSAMILSAMMVVSRLLGVIRNRTLTGYFTKEQLDIFFAAFKLPDFIFELIITGALSSAFIPIFIKYKRDPETLKQNISTIINTMMSGLMIFMLITIVFADKIIPIITPGFSPSDTQTVIELSRIFILTQLPFMVLGNILSGIGQANKTFILTAVAPIIYTLGVIFGTMFLSESMGMYGPVIGVTTGAVLFFVVQLPILLISKFQYSLTTFKRPVIREFFTLVIPRTLSVFSSQIDSMIDLWLASLIGGGSYTVIYFAQRLQLFPVAFVGMAFGQASLPYLISLIKNEDIKNLRILFVDSILQLLYLSVPLAVFLIFARTPLVRIAYGGKMFDWIATVLTAKSLSAFALSVPIHSIFYFITRAFYAYHDTKTPFVISMISVLVNALFSIYFILILHLPVWWLGISFSISITLNVTLLLIFFYRKIGGFDLEKLIKNTTKIYIIAILSAVPSYIFIKLFDMLVLDTARTINVFVLLFVASIIYFSSYLFFSWFFTVEEIYLLGKLLLKMKALKKRFEVAYVEMFS